MSLPRIPYEIIRNKTIFYVTCVKYRTFSKGREYIYIYINGNIFNVSIVMTNKGCQCPMRVYPSSRS